MRKSFGKFTLMLFTVSGLALTGTQPVQAQNLVDKIKGLIIKEDDGKAKPHETLEAPFSTDGQTTTNNQDSLLFLYDKELTGTKDGNILSRAHRTEEQMSEWVMGVTTNLLSFDFRDAQNHINKYQTLFLRPALKQYVRQLNNTEVIKAMKQSHLESIAMFEDMPLVVNKGNFQGVYRWVFDFPINMTFRYSGDRPNPKARETTIVMQVKMRVARVPTEKGLDGALIESWTMERIK